MWIIVSHSTLVKRSILRPGMHNDYFMQKIMMISNANFYVFCTAKHIADACPEAK